MSREFFLGAELLAKEAGKRQVDRIGQHWSRSNDEFEARNPNFGRRVVRAFNPVTGPGSAMGQAYDFQQQGKPWAAAGMLATAIPAVGVMRAVPSPVLGAAMQRIPSYAGTGAAVGGQALVGASLDKAMSPPRKKAPSIRDALDQR